MTDEQIALEHGLLYKATHQEHQEYNSSVLAALAAARQDERQKILTDGWRQCAKGQHTTQFCSEAVAAEQRCRELEGDSRRLDWLLGKVSGAEYRRIGIEYEDRYSLLAAIDTALRSSHD